MYDINFFHKELLERKSASYAFYKEYTECDLAINMVNQEGLSVEEVAWEYFYPEYLIIENPEYSITEKCKGVQLEKFIKKFSQSSIRVRLLKIFRDNPYDYIPTRYHVDMISTFEDECARLICEYNDNLLDEYLFSEQSVQDFMGKLTREDVLRIERMAMKNDNLKESYDKLKLENIELEKEIELLKKRIKELENQPQSQGLTVDQICDYAKEFLERNERQIISHMLLNIIENPDKETRAKIKSLDKKTPLDAQKVVLGDEVQTKIVKS